MAIHKKNPAAVALGRLGGSAPTKKPKGFAAMSKKRLKEIIQKRDSAPTKKPRGFAAMSKKRLGEVIQKRDAARRKKGAIR
jgi:hypothetical protein